MTVAYTFETPKEKRDTMLQTFTKLEQEFEDKGHHKPVCLLVPPHSCTQTRQTLLTELANRRYNCLITLQAQHREDEDL